jgi:hypothetical protein
VIIIIFDEKIKEESAWGLNLTMHVKQTAKFVLIVYTTKQQMLTRNRTWFMKLTTVYSSVVTYNIMLLLLLCVGVVRLSRMLLLACV